MKKKILNVALIMLLIVSLFVLTACGEETKSKEKKLKHDAEKVIEEFYAYAVELDYEAMFNLIDFAGMSVFQESGEDNLEEFKSEYEAYIETEEWKELENQMDSLIDSMVSMMEDSESEEMATTKILSTEVEEISEDLYKVEAEIETTDADGEKTTENLAHYVFEGKDGYKIVYAEGM